MPNPAHKRSPLVALTTAGKRRFEEIKTAERELIRKARLPLSNSALVALAGQLEELSAALDGFVAQGL